MDENGVFMGELLNGNLDGEHVKMTADDCEEKYEFKNSIGRKL